MKQKFFRFALFFTLGFIAFGAPNRDGNQNAMKIYLKLVR